MLVNLYNFNGVLDDLYDELLSRNEIIEGWGNADVVILWQDVMSACLEVATDAKKAGKRVIVAEHGLMSINDYIPPLSRPLIADCFMAWGKVTRDILVKEAGIPKEKVVITGTTVFSDMGPRVKHDGKIVLFAPRHWSEELKENINIAKNLKRYRSAQILSKIIFGEHDHEKYPNPIPSSRHITGHLQICYEALKTADVLVGVGEGTIAALAYSMDIPVISVDEWEPKLLLDKMYTKEIFDSQISYACKKVRLKDLHDALDFELKNPESMAEERARFRKEYLDGADPNKALKKQLKVIYGKNT